MNLMRRSWRQNSLRRRALLVSDSGGHLTELLVLSQAFDRNWEKIFATFPDLFARLQNAYYFKRSKWIFLDIIIFGIKMFWLIFTKRPQIVVSTGSYIGMVAIILAKSIFRIPCVFMECSAQVYTPSRTGKIVYPFVDLFLVQWEELRERYGDKAKYVGGLI